METYRHCRPGLRVRFLALHPCLVLLFVILFSVSASGTDADRNDLEYYLNTDSTLMDIVLSDGIMPLAGSMPSGTYHVEGEYSSGNWTYTSGGSSIPGGNNPPRVTNISSLESKYFAKLDEGDQILAGVMLDALLARSSGGLTILDLREYDNDEVSAFDGDTVVPLNSYDVPNLLALITKNQHFQDKYFKEYSKNQYYNAYHVTTGSQGTGLRFSDILAIISNNQTEQYKQFNDYFTMTGTGFHIASNSSYKSNNLLNGIGTLSWNQSSIYNRLGSLLPNVNVPALEFTDSLTSANTSWYGGGQSVGDLLAVISRNQFSVGSGLRALIANPVASMMLSQSGDKVTASVNQPLSTTLLNGFAGLATIMYGGERAVAVDLVNPDNPLEKDSFQTFTTVFGLLGYIAETQQNLLTKLQFVLASDDDIKMKQDEKENQDAAVDNFFGDGEGAVKPTDISDAAGVAGNIKQTFDGAGSVSDAFTPVNDAANYSFFSQEVANELDKVSQPASQMDEDYLEMFQVDEDGFYSLKPSSLFDVSKYLEELGK